MANVSVIIPLFNKEKYVNRALDSVFSQTYQDFEIVVVDDGSTDSSLELVQRDLDSRLRLVHQQNQGPGAARNRGIRETPTPYLAFLDADDEWLPDFLNRYMEALRANPDCDYVVGPWFEGNLQADRSELWKKTGVEEGLWRLPVNISHTELHNLLITLHWTCTMVCKRHVVERYGGFYAKTNCTYGEDRYLELQLLLNHRMYRMIEPLAWYHTETFGVCISSLGVKPRPLPPILTDPEPVRKNCPQLYREVLEWYFASNAIGFAQEYANANDLSTALSLMHRFPQIKKFRKKFAQLLFGISFAKVVTALTGKSKKIGDSLQ